MNMVFLIKMASYETQGARGREKTTNKVTDFLAVLQQEAVSGRLTETGLFRAVQKAELNLTTKQWRNLREAVLGANASCPFDGPAWDAAQSWVSGFVGAEKAD
jgi:hypothetical protein